MLNLWGASPPTTQPILTTAPEPDTPDTLDIPLDRSPDLDPLALIEDLGMEVLWQRIIPAAAPETSEFPDTLPSSLQDALVSQGINNLYSHQVQSRAVVRRNKDLVLTPPTAAGKTLAAYVPVIEGCLKGRRCLAFYGLKALALDQDAKMTGLLENLGDEAPELRFARLTGDTLKEEREEIIAAKPHIIGSTPEFIHFALGSAWKSRPWQLFLRKLRYVIVDEMHTYRGIYGANMALLLRRLRLAVDRYGGDSKQLQFLFLSATCGNPREMARKLSGRSKKEHPDRLRWIHKSGAAAAERQVFCLQPSPSPNVDAAKLMAGFIRQGLKGITFCSSRESVKHIVDLARQECRNLGIKAGISAFYGSLTEADRKRIIQELETGSTHWIVATEALEAGIDLPVLDVAIIRGFPGYRMNFWQRAGRAGRKNRGIIIYLPSNSLIDILYSTEEKLFAAPENVAFNANYPLLLAKHLLCAAAESGFESTQEIKQYFGPKALKVAQMLLEKGLLIRGRSKLYAKGFPHGDVNFRGGIIQGTFVLIDQSNKEVLEKMSDDIAYREVFPGALYRRQGADGALVPYRCTTLDLDARQALLERLDIDAAYSADEDGPELLRRVNVSAVYTSAATETEVTADFPLTPLVSIPLSFPASDAPAQDKEPPALLLELFYGNLTQKVVGYSTAVKRYERVCLNKKCLNYRQPVPTKRCTLCGKVAREAEVSTTAKESTFDQEYAVSYETPIARLSLNTSARRALVQQAKLIRDTLKQNRKTRELQTLANHKVSFIALHSIGHQLMAALPLTVMAPTSDLQFMVQEEDGQYIGIFHDTASGGNGATEAVVQHFEKLVQEAHLLAHTCPCETGCSQCIVQYGCPDGNQGLLKPLGLSLLEAISPHLIQPPQEISTIDDV